MRRSTASWRCPAPFGLAARAAYICLLGLATLSPFRFELEGATALRELEQAFQLGYTPRDAVDAVRNLALFAGWGALWVATSPARTRVAILGLPLLTGFLMGASVEAIQLAMPARTTSPIDILTNTAGSGLGALLIVAMIGTTARLRERKSYVGVPAATFFGTYLAAAVLEMTFPLMLKPIPGVYGGPLRRARASFGELGVDSILTVPLTTALLLLPLGVFAVAVWREAGMTYGSAVRRTAVSGIALSVAAELAHAPLGLPIRVGALMTHAAAIALGAIGARRLLPMFSQRLRGGARPAALLGGYTVLLGLWMWRPFVPVFEVAPFLAQLAPERLIPLYSLGARVDLYSVADIGKSFFLCLPVGALLAVWPLRRGGLLAGPMPGLYLVAGLEVGQLFLLDRFFDLTDILVQAAAVAIGWVVVRTAAYRVHGQLWSPGHGPGIGRESRREAVASPVAPGAGPRRRV